jgi:hypothetical protein
VEFVIEKCQWGMFAPSSLFSPANSHSTNLITCVNLPVINVMKSADSVVIQRTYSNSVLAIELPRQDSKIYTDFSRNRWHWKISQVSNTADTLESLGLAIQFTLKQTKLVML